MVPSVGTEGAVVSTRNGLVAVSGPPASAGDSCPNTSTALTTKYCAVVLAVVVNEVPLTVPTLVVGLAAVPWYTLYPTRSLSAGGAQPIVIELAPTALVSAVGVAGAELLPATEVENEP